MFTKRVQRIYDGLVQKDGVQNKLHSCYLLAQEVKSKCSDERARPVITNLQVKIREDRFALSERKMVGNRNLKNMSIMMKIFNINRELGNLRVPLQETNY